MKKIIAIAFLFPLIFSCGKEEPKNNNTDIIEYNDSNSSDQQANTQSTNLSNVVNQIVIKANEDMSYDKTQFTVKKGEEITLTLVNVGTSSKEAMGHNLVLLKQGTDESKFVFDASSEKSNDYIPPKLANQIIAHTKLLGPKENDQIKFKLDAIGTYTFICTFPGHSATMRGTITVI